MSGTAVVHTDATLTPTKQEVLRAWLPTRPWFVGDSADDLRKVDSYRFVDPDGEVGIETMIATAGGHTYHVPLTYRGAPLEGAEQHLIAEMDHSKLGKRYVYDATADPVYVAELLRVIEDADDEADLSSGGEHMHVRGSGTLPLQNAATPTLRVARNLDQPDELPHGHALGTLEGTWTQDGKEREAVLAILR